MGAAEQGHAPAARVLVDGALEAIHLHGNTLEAAIDNVVDHLGVKLFGQCRETSCVGEQDGDLPAFAFQRAA
jgi:hypothetical protein